MATVAINSSQNVKIDFTLASVGERIFACIIDFIVMFGYIIVALFLFNEIEKFIPYERKTAFYILMALPVVFYTLISESVMQGQTLGKKAMKIKVVKIDGYQATFPDYAMRWFARLVDVYVSSGIVGIASIITSANNQRLGDMAAGTTVISLKNRVNISHTIFENIAETYVLAFPQVVVLSDNDMRIIKNNFVKAQKNRDGKLMIKLSDKIQQTIGVQPDSKIFTHQSFIDRVIKDYNFVTGKEQ